MQTVLDNPAIMTPSQLTEYLIFCINNQFPCLITGKPGIGKTDTMKQATAAAAAKLIISHPVVSDPTDYKGLPFAGSDGAAHFLPFDDLKALIDAKEPTVFFCDDLGQAPASVQASLMQLFHGGKINGHHVSKYVTFMAATNRAEDRAGVTGILEPFKSRAAIIELIVSAEDWIQWALTNGMPTELIAFIRFKNEMLDNWKPSKDIVNAANPRTVANVGRQQLAGLKADFELPVFTGAAGKDFAIQYTAFLKLFRSMPSIDQIILDPTGAPVPTEPGILYALTGALAKRLEPGNFSAIVSYLDRVPGEIAVSCIKDAVTQHGTKITTTREFIQAMTTGKFKQLLAA